MEGAAAWRRSSIPLSSPSEVRFSSADRFFHVFDRLPEANYLTGLANLPPLELGGGEAARLFLALRNMPDNTELGLNRRSRPFPWAERTLSLSVSTLLALVALTVLLATATYWHPAAAPRTNAASSAHAAAEPSRERPAAERGLLLLGAGAGTPVSFAGHQIPSRRPLRS